MIHAALVFCAVMGILVYSVSMVLCLARGVVEGKPFMFLLGLMMFAAGLTAGIIWLQP